MAFVYSSMILGMLMGSVTMFIVEITVPAGIPLNQVSASYLYYYFLFLIYFYTSLIFVFVLPQSGINDIGVSHLLPDGQYFVGNVVDEFIRANN